MQLKTVVFPAPFGPMTAVMEWERALNDTSSIATSPPKRIVRCSTSMSGAMTWGAVIHRLQDAALSTARDGR